MRLLSLLLGLCSLVVFGCSCATQSASCTEVKDGWGPAGTAAIRTEVVATGLEVPWGLAFLPGNDVLVTERPGRVRLIRAGALVEAPVATVQTGSADEGGLLGIAAHPEVASNGLFYLYVTTAQGEEISNRVDQWKLSADRTAATFEKTIFGPIPAAKFHDGGRIRFGPDGMLYVGTGDSREPSLSQKLDSSAGKLLRLMPDGTVPSDNPFPGNPTYLLGIRNLQGFDWREAGVLYVTDHGPSGELLRFGHDEVSVARAGQNLGWADIYSCESKEGMVSPVLTFDTAAPPGGAAVYTGDAIAGWKGSLLFGTLGSRHLHRVTFDGDALASHEVYLQDAHGRLRETVMGPDGHLYVTTSNCDGRGTCPAEKDQVLRVLPQ